MADVPRLAATVSLVLAAAKVRDHVADGDGVAGRYGIRVAVGRLARRWARQGAETGGELGIRLALAEVEFTDAKLAHLLLEDELTRSVRGTFGHEGPAHQSRAVSSSHPGRFAPYQAGGLGQNIYTGTP